MFFCQPFVVDSQLIPIVLGVVELRLQVFFLTLAPGRLLLQFLDAFPHVLKLSDPSLMIGLKLIVSLSHLLQLIMLEMNQEGQLTVGLK